MLIYTYNQGTIENYQQFTEEVGDQIPSLKEVIMNIGTELRQQGILEGKRIGILEGKKIGILEGEKIGILEGKRIGILEGKMETAKNLFSLGFSVEQIIKATGLTIEQINQLKS